MDKNPQLKPWFQCPKIEMDTHFLDLNNPFLANSGNGLLYFMQDGFVDDYCSLVCNPITSEYIIISDAADPKMRLHSHNEGLLLGFSPGTEQYKVFIIFHRMNIAFDKSAAQVVVIGSDSWRDIDDTLPCGRHFFWDKCQTQLVNGLMYLHSIVWPSLISFDFEREKFGDVASPPEFQDDRFITNHFTSIGVLGGFPCPSCNEFSANRVYLWVVRKCGNQDFWKKEFVVDTITMKPRGGPLYGKFKQLQFLGNAELLMLRNGNTLVFYDPGTETLRYFRLYSVKLGYKFVALTPSLVPLKDILKVEKVLSLLRPWGDEREL